MPEIGEVARVVHYIRKHLVGKTLAKVIAQPDEIIFGKVGTSAEEVMKALTGKKIVGARQQGKYFWMVMSSPPHLLMHFGMAGWFKFRNEETFYYKPSKQEDPSWPPKYWKFSLETAEEPVCEAAFVDFRRLARIRLLDCAAEDIRKIDPLVKNGPDPVIDKDVLTEEWLGEKLGSKRVPIKALLLDQANISGIGNWIGDEVLYDAKIHPEQYSNTLSAAQIKQLHKSIQYVCGFAVDHLADSSTFPEEWLFKHRWAKGKKDSSSTLPNGSKFVFLTVGGRTSCVVPSVQKKTGPVAKDVKQDEDEEEDEDGEEVVKPKGGKKASKVEKGNLEETATRPATEANKGKKRGAKQEAQPAEIGVAKGEDATEEETKPGTKKRKSNVKAETNGLDAQPKRQKKAKSEVNGPKKEAQDESSGRRRSTRTTG